MIELLQKGLNMTTAQQAKSIIEICRTIAEMIRLKGSIPSGELYVQVMGSLSLENYQWVINTLVNAKVIKSESHLLTWNVK